MEHDATETNVAAVDGWTFVHVGFAFVSGAARVPRVIAYTLIVGTELVELMLRTMIPFFRESTVNTLADLAVGFVAYELGRASTS